MVRQEDLKKEMSKESRYKDTTWLMSACLLGHNCRYNAEVLEKSPLSSLPILSQATIVPICPEMAGGLPTPRPAAQINGPSGAAVLDGQARVLTSGGHDVTSNFIQGAEIAVEAAKTYGATHACLKARSPSCGVGQTHGANGLINAHGVAAAALKRAGLALFTEEDCLSPIDD